MVLLFAAIALIILMVYIMRQLHDYLPPTRYRQIMQLLILMYLLINWSLTLLTRTQGEYPVIFVPLRAYLDALGWDTRTFDDLKKLLCGLWEDAPTPSLSALVCIAQNIILFLPFGFLLIAAYPHAGIGKILLLGFVLSLFIEVCQLVFHLGWFEVDDVLHNVLGTYVGVRLYRRVMK